MVPVGDERGLLPVEPTDETSCGDEDLPGDVVGLIAGQIRVGG